MVLNSALFSLFENCSLYLKWMASSSSISQQTREQASQSRDEKTKSASIGWTFHWCTSSCLSTYNNLDFSLENPSCITHINPLLSRGCVCKGVGVTLCLLQTHFLYGCMDDGCVTWMMVVSDGWYRRKWRTLFLPLLH